MELKQTFQLGGMNKDIDERLLAKGLARDILNMRISKTEGSDAGAAEPTIGNYEFIEDVDVTDQGLYLDGKCIGIYADEVNGKIYTFVTGAIPPDFNGRMDYIAAYSVQYGDGGALGAKEVVRVLASTYPTANPEQSLLNFENLDSFITGINVLTGTDGTQLLAWTQENESPRLIDVNLASQLDVDGFDEDDIALIKRPPVFSPEVDLVNTGENVENTISDKFISFGYRYVYANDMKSAISFYTDYTFFPKVLELNYDSMKNEGMVNAFNAVDVTLNTGDSRVIGLELIFKESLSNARYLIQRFDKNEMNWLDNTDVIYRFKNNKSYSPLPESEGLRLYDNLPITAKAQTVVNNRLIYGNWTEGYDLIDENDEDVYVDYEPRVVSVADNAVNYEAVLDTSFKYIGGTGKAVEDVLGAIDLTGVDLVEGAAISLSSIIIEDIDDPESYSENLTYLLPQDYATVSDLAYSAEFVEFVTVSLTNLFENSGAGTVPPDTTGSTVFGYEIDYSSIGSSIIKILAPGIQYQTSNPTTPIVNTWWKFDRLILGYVKTGSVQSLKSNRSYEACMIYYDKYNRSSPALTDPDSTFEITADKSVFQNHLEVDINNKPPAWATKFKIGLKQNTSDYETVYATLFYVEGNYRWVRLEAAHKDKVQEGDILIVKKDVDGPISELIETTVLEVTDQPTDFIKDNVDPGNEPIIEEGGLYMKLRPSNYNLDYTDLEFREWSGYDSKKQNPAVVILGNFNDEVTGDLIAITAGSVADVYFRNWESDGFLVELEKTVVAQANYVSIQEWFETEDVITEPFWIDGETKFYMDGTNLKLQVRGSESGAEFERNKLEATVRLRVINGYYVFETKPLSADNEIFYETADTFLIENGLHKGNVQDQTSTLPAIVDLSAFNCYSFGNGAESYKIKDDLTSNALKMDGRATSTLDDRYRSKHRRAGLTYGGKYDDDASYNALNVFNAATVNYKDLDVNYGSIQKLHSRDTNLLVCQYNKISQLLYDKNALYNADGSTNINASNTILGDQVAYTGEYGICNHPESFAAYGNRVYFTDRAKGAVLQLSNNGLTVISDNGMRSYFKDRMISALSDTCIGSYDPWAEEYILFVENRSFGDETLGYSPSGNMWTSRYSYLPQNMCNINGVLYTVNSGKLWEHYELVTDPQLYDYPNVNMFYGSRYDSSVTFMMNDYPSDVKVYKTLGLESSERFSATIKAFMSDKRDFTSTTIGEDEYVYTEGKLNASINGDTSTDISGSAAYGIGNIIDVDGLVLTVETWNNDITVGDSIGIYEDGVEVERLSIEGSDKENSTITVNTTPTRITPFYCIGLKNAFIEGGEIRGYTAEITLTSSTNDWFELFAVNMEAFKSFL